MWGNYLALVLREKKAFQWPTQTHGSSSGHRASKEQYLNKTVTFSIYNYFTYSCRYFLWIRCESILSVLLPLPLNHFRRARSIFLSFRRVQRCLYSHSSHNRKKTILWLPVNALWKMAAQWQPCTYPQYIPGTSILDPQPKRSQEQRLTRSYILIQAAMHTKLLEL